MVKFGNQNNVVFNTMYNNTDFYTLSMNFVIIFSEILLHKNPLDTNSEIIVSEGIWDLFDLLSFFENLSWTHNDACYINKICNT